jgi:CheY-like chemotaxis protein
LSQSAILLHFPPCISGRSLIENALSDGFFTSRYMTEHLKPLLSNSTILLVDDSDDDTFLMYRAFEKAHLINPLIRVNGGEEALTYLGGEGKFADREKYPLPFLLLLDLKMPRVNGFDVLRWLREQDHLKEMLVVVLTSSTREPDINLAYELGADSYLTKLAGFDELVQLLNRLKGYWLITNVRPPPHRVEELELV